MKCCKNQLIIIPLFTLGSIYSTNASGAEEIPEIIKIDLKRVKNPYWPEANQLATVYKHGRGFELGTTVNKSSYRTERGLNSGASELQVRRSNHSSTLPPSKAPPKHWKHFTDS